MLCCILLLLCHVILLLCSKSNFPCHAKWNYWQVMSSRYCVSMIIPFIILQVIIDMSYHHFASYLLCHIISFSCFGSNLTCFAVCEYCHVMSSPCYVLNLICNFMVHVNIAMSCPFIVKFELDSSCHDGCFYCHVMPIHCYILNLISHVMMDVIIIMSWSWSEYDLPCHATCEYCNVISFCGPNLNPNCLHVTREYWHACHFSLCLTCRYCVMSFSQITDEFCIQSTFA